MVVRPAASSTRASSANAFRTSWEPANRRVHSSSDASSDCSHPAIRSCSSAGRDDILEKTLSRARVMLQAYCPGGCRTSRCSGRRPVNSRSKFNEPGPRGPGSATIDHHLTAFAAERQGVRRTTRARNIALRPVCQRRYAVEECRRRGTGVGIPDGSRSVGCLKKDWMRRAWCRMDVHCLRHWDDQCPGGLPCEIPPHLLPVLF